MVNKVGILDCDWHYGNGTDDIINRLDLQNDVRHFTSGAVMHCNASAYLNWLETSIDELIGSEVDIVLYQAGADAHNR